MTDLTTRLEQAIDGLLYPSESDAPLQVFVWPEGTPFSLKALRTHIATSKKTPIQKVDLDTFFRPVTTPQDWFGEAEQERMEKFTALLTLLKAELSDITVYKVGKIDIDVYVLGHTSAGEYLGITTKVVET